MEGRCGGGGAPVGVLHEFLHVDDVRVGADHLPDHDLALKVFEGVALHVGLVHFFHRPCCAGALFYTLVDCSKCSCRAALRMLVYFFEDARIPSPSLDPSSGEKS